MPPATAEGITSGCDRGSSVRLDLPEAVRAVDRLVHPRLEGHLRLVPARRADRGKVLARPSLLGSLVAPRAADRPDVVAAAVARRASVGTARCAPLGIRRERLLLVVL